MLTLEDSVRFVSRKSNISMAHLILAIFLLMPLAGCSGEGGGGPIISSLPTPTDDAAGSDSDQATNLEVAGSDGEQDPTITMTPTAAGVTAHVTWVPPPGIEVTGYHIHYGKRSSEEPSSEESALRRVRLRRTKFMFFRGKPGRRGSTRHDHRARTQHNIFFRYPCVQRV